LFNLSDFLPKKPTEVELKVIKEMFEASVDGEAFDMERWGQYYKPAGMGGSGQATGNNNAPAAKAAPAPSASAEDEDPPFEQAAPAATPAAAPAASGDAGSRAADIIAMIRNRQKQ
jgi:hypothetical protein